MENPHTIFKNRILYDPASQLLGTYLQEMKSVCQRVIVMLTAELLTAAKKGSQFQCPENDNKEYVAYAHNTTEP